MQKGIVRLDDVLRIGIFLSKLRRNEEAYLDCGMCPARILDA